MIVRENEVRLSNYIYHKLFRKKMSNCQGNQERRWRVANLSPGVILFNVCESDEPRVSK